MVWGESGDVSDDESLYWCLLMVLSRTARSFRYACNMKLLLPFSLVGSGTTWGCFSLDTCDARSVVL